MLVTACGPIAAQAPDSLPRYTLDTLSTTAMRAPLVVVTAPFAVTAISGPDLNRGRAGTALDQALLLVPGVQVDNRYNPALGDRISIRGFGARTQFGVRGVRILVDGIPATFPDGQSALNHVDPAALERVEVLRGPAAALYGNASGGIIRMETAGGSGAPFHARLISSAGSHGTTRLAGSAAGEKGGLGYHLGVTRLTTDGYRDHSAASSWLARGRLESRRGGNRLRLSWSGVGYEARNPGSLSDSLLRVGRRQAFVRNVAQGTGEEGRQAQLGLGWEHRGRVGLDLTGYGTWRRIDNPIPAAIVVLHREVAGVRAALSDAHPLGGLRAAWTLGAEAERQRDDRRNFANQAGDRGALLLDQRERVGGRALFAQLGISWPDRLEVLAALRNDRFVFDANDRMPVTALDPDDSGERGFDAWSPALGVSARVLRGVWGYGNLSSAFETPTTTELVNRPDGAGGFNAGLRPQRTAGQEVGLKMRLPSGGLLELSAFRASVRGQLVPYEVEGADGRVFYRNAGRSRHHGVELGLAVQLSPAIRLRGAYTWTDARFTDYRVGDLDLAGNPVPGIASHRLAGSLWVERESGAFAGVELRVVSETPVADADGAGALASPAYALVDLRGGLGEVRLGPARLSPWITFGNVTASTYNASVVVNAFGGRYYEPGPGRTVYLGIEAATLR